MELVGYIDEGFRLLRSRPRAVAIRLVLGLLLPAFLFTILYVLLIAALLAWLGPLDGLAGLFTKGLDGLLSQLGGMLFFYLVALLVFAALAGWLSLLSRAMAISSLSSGLPSGPGVSSGAYSDGKKLSGPLGRYSFLFNLAVAAFVIALMFAGGIVSFIELRMGEGPGADLFILMLRILIMTVLVLGLVYLYALYFRGIGYLVLEGKPAASSLALSARSFSKNPSELDRLVLSVAGVALIQVMMLIAAFALGYVSPYVTVFWVLFWVALNEYLGLVITAAVLVSHCQGEAGGLSDTASTGDEAGFTGFDLPSGPGGWTT